MPFQYMIFAPCFFLNRTISFPCSSQLGLYLSEHIYHFFWSLSSRSLVFRDVAVMATGCKISRRHHQMASHGTVYDMAVDPKLEVAITVGQVKTSI